ncbi:MAG: hydrogenase formation protein HypD [Chitinispirillaceae bacterium]|jgi:hydrogenase expression/formation protein HypD|nr:hydrogenase formation protein HypD [Chitinispirillaceae bacterium]
MKSNGFSDPAIAAKMLEAIHRCASGLGDVRLMEVCGTHTMEIGRMGLRSLLPKNVELFSGPGCPVCVTPASYLDATAELSLAKNVRIATFGDLVRVPGERTSFAEVKSRGAPIDVVTTPRAALDIARSNPGQEVMFTAIGFETTIPSTASAMRVAAEEGLQNISFFVAHRLVPPVLDALIGDPSLAISGFLLPGHVSAIIGEAAYAPLVARGIPGAITGFEPLDILAGILAALDMIRKKNPLVRNEYTRIVKPGGNPSALALIDEIYEPCDAVLRGIGMLPMAGLRLRKKYRQFDAAVKFGLQSDNGTMPDGCSCGDVLRGRVRPDKCPLFGTACTPGHPIGPCMVSSEGSCAAYFKYGW